MARGNRFEFHGMAKFREALRNLPYELRNEATVIVEDSAKAAKEEMAAKYPISLGRKRRGRFIPGGQLRKGLKLEYRGGQTPFGAWVTVRNTAPHANIFENGTELRTTATGAERGSAKPGRVFVPIAIKHRRRMNRQLMRMLESHGLLVTGDGDL